jgi:hypothetical protein
VVARTRKRCMYGDAWYSLHNRNTCLSQSDLKVVAPLGSLFCDVGRHLRIQRSEPLPHPEYVQAHHRLRLIDFSTWLQPSGSPQKLVNLVMPGSRPESSVIKPLTSNHLLSCSLHCTRSLFSPKPPDQSLPKYHGLPSFTPHLFGYTSLGVFSLNTRFINFLWHL